MPTRTELIHKAAALPVGDPARRDILAAIKKADLFDAERKAAYDVLKILEHLDKTHKALLKSLEKLHRMAHPRQPDEADFWKATETLLKLIQRFQKDFARIEDDFMGQMADLVD